MYICTIYEILVTVDVSWI